VSHKKDNDRLRTQRQLDKLKWETANELGLKDDLSTLGNALTLGDADKIGGNTTKKLVKAGERAIAEEGDRKARLNLKENQ